MTSVIPPPIQQPLSIRVVLRGGPADGVEVALIALTRWTEVPVEGEGPYRYARTTASDEWGRAIYEADPAPKLRGPAVLEFLLGEFPSQRDIAIEYVGEAEHGEGEHVWDTMYDGDTAKIAEDFKLYLENRE